MGNELLLIGSVILYYGGLLLFYKLYGKVGLFVFNVISIIIANIEVQLFIEAFKMEMTLGNVVFASTFLVTDIMSEKYTKTDAKRAVNIGILVSIMLIIVTRLWLVFDSLDQTMFSAFQIVFGQTFRIVLSGLVVYAVVQKFDIMLYHYWWDLTTRLFGNKDKGLWIRNNGSTLVSQFFNALLFNILAFYGTVDNQMLASFVISTFIIYVVTTIIDTPFLYLARKIKANKF